MREDIITRLVAVATGMDAFRGVFRNVIEFPDNVVPACAVLEGDEEAADDPELRPANAPRIVRMFPQIVVYAGERVEDVGSSLNELCEGLISAVLTDSQLVALTLNSRGPRYLGMESDIAFGRQMVGRMALKFSIPYVIRP